MAAAGQQWSLGHGRGDTAASQTQTLHTRGAPPASSRALPTSSEVAAPGGCVRTTPGNVQRGTGRAHCGVRVVVAARSRPKDCGRGRCHGQTRPQRCATAVIWGWTLIHGWAWWTVGKVAAGGARAFVSAKLESPHRIHTRKKKTGAPRPPRWPGRTPRVGKRGSLYAGDDPQRPRRGPHRFNRTRAVRRRPATCASTVKSRPQMTCAVGQ